MPSSPTVTDDAVATHHHRKRRPLFRYEGDVDQARREFETRPGANLRYVLRKRIEWMRKYVPPGARAVEVGCGAGFTPRFLHREIELTDTEARPWVNRVVDAQAMPYDDASLDVLIANNVVHHLAYPTRFFDEAARVLRPGGHVLLQECNCSLTTRIALRLTGHEEYDLSADPFDASRPCNNVDDPWSANCAIPNLLFDDVPRFTARYPQFDVVETGLSEFFVNFNSGGVVSRAPYLPLPEVALRALDAVDVALVAIAPNVFASQRRIVLRRR